MVRVILWTSALLIVGMLAAGAGGLWVLHKYGRDLPDYRQLADYDPEVMTRVFAGDGRLLAEYAVEKRVFVPIRAIPKPVINAFLAAEDKTFYSHPGVDFAGIANAVLINLKRLGGNQRPVGASTITQQVAKNFLLTNEVSITRKIKEAILAFRIERAFSKDRILELYLNEIYLGFGSYGVAAAALNYFDKSLDELTVSEAAFLAALPKAPNNYHPITKHEAAVGRRNWVIQQMHENGKIDAQTAQDASAEPLVIAERRETEFVTADFFAEEVRRELSQRFGERQLYKGGLAVHTTLDPGLQRAAYKALREGLEAYDRRHGYRGPVTKAPQSIELSTPSAWRAYLRSVEVPEGIGDRQLAVVLGVDDGAAEIGVADGSRGTIPLSELKWAREYIERLERGPVVKTADQVLQPGDVVITAPVAKNDEGEAYPEETYGLYQIPEVNGALVALDPHTGRVLAMQGGYSHQRSQFNRATQAYRQPGSAFKPFVYLSALEEGLSPATLILDAPFVIDQGPGLPKWRPANYAKKFYGPSTMRLGLEKSRNLMTVRLAQTIGMDKVAETAEAFDIVNDMQETLAMSLGAAETTLMRLTAAYGMLVNGGKKIRPSIIDRVQDRTGQTIFKHDRRPCSGCEAPAWRGQDVPQIPDTRPQVTDPQSAYQIVNLLKGVVERGTGWRIREIPKPIAGKTGTTDEERDTWFMGFAADLAVGVFVGFDEPQPLGRNETGSSVSSPIFKDFMQTALKDQPATPFRVPPGIHLVRVNARTGQPARPGDKDVIYEAFKPDSVPTGESAGVIRGEGWTPQNDGGGAGAYSGQGGFGVGAPATGTGGLY